MTEKPNVPRGRPITNKVDPIPASAEKIAREIFRASDKKIAKAAKPKRKKPN
jgi:hypothetical protein